MVTIRRIDVNEIKLVADLFNKYRIFYKQPSNYKLAEKFLYERLKNNESVIFIATIEKNGKFLPIGFTQLYPKISSVSALKNWHIGDLYVELNYRKKGIGNELLKTALNFSKDQGAKLVSLNTAKDNIIAQGLYETIGFVRQEQLPEFYYYQHNIVDSDYD